MSDGITDARRAGEIGRKYEDAVSGIKNLNESDLCAMFNIDDSSITNLLTILESETKEFSIEYGLGYYMRSEGEFDVAIPIPGFMNRETFRSKILRLALIRAASLNRWFKTDIGKQALSNLE